MTHQVAAEQHYAIGSILLPVAVNLYDAAGLELVVEQLGELADVRDMRRTKVLNEVKLEITMKTHFVVGNVGQVIQWAPVDATGG